MIDPRRQVITLVGETGAGKSTLLMELIDKYDRGMVTVLDPQNDPTLREKFPLIEMDQVALQDSGNYRVLSEEWMEFTDILTKKYTRTSKDRGLAVYDDMSGRITAKFEYDPLTKLNTSCRHIHLDIAYTFHKLWRVPPYVIGYSTILILFKTGEPLDRTANGRFPHSDKIMKAFQKVNASVDRHAYEIVKLYG